MLIICKIWCTKKKQGKDHANLVLFKKIDSGLLVKIQLYMDKKL